jgi:hypothetical protein
MAIGARQRRRALIVAALVLAGVNVVTLHWRPLTAPKTWVVHHPVLEAQQAADPYNLLYGSDGWDKRVPVSSIMDPAFDEERPSMFRDMLACGPRSITVEQSHPFPIRFYLTPIGEGSALPDCVRSKLPTGYVIERSGVPGKQALPHVHYPSTTELSATVNMKEP